LTALWCEQKACPEKITHIRTESRSAEDSFSTRFLFI